MSYQNYVIAAYSVFAAFLAWDFLVPRLRLARVRRAIAQRARRDDTRSAGAAP
jgi:heme exporter protein D